MPDTAPPGAATGPCDRCGAATDLRFGDLRICEDCYCAAGACCAGETDSPASDRES